MVAAYTGSKATGSVCREVIVFDLEDVPLDHTEPDGFVIDHAIDLGVRLMVYGDHDGG